MSEREIVTCGLCGEPMPPGEEMFKYHGYSGPCPTPAPKPPQKATCETHGHIYGHEGVCLFCRTPKPTPEPQTVCEWRDITAEVARAVAKFPTWPTDPLHALAVLGEEFGELTKAVVQETYEPHKNEPGELRKEAIQTAAMALRFVCSLDAYRPAPAEQHEQSLPLTRSPESPNEGAK